MKYIILIIVFSLNFACNSTKQVNKTKSFVPSAPVLVYKTTNNYFNNVPIILSADKSKIVSYPHPTDIKKGDKYATPTKLKNDYLLDNRGIGLNVAFLKLTYEEYAKLDETLSIDELKSLIIDDNPLIELYNCGLKSDFGNLEKQLNETIKKGELDKYERLK